MNKLLVGNKDKIDDVIITEDTEIEINLSDIDKDIDICIMDGMCLKVLEFDNNTQNNIRYILKDNATVIVNKFTVDSNDKVNIVIDGEGATINFYTALVNKNSSNYTQNINHNKSYTSSNVINHGINFSQDELKILVNGKIDENSKEVECSQDNKIIDMNGGKNSIEPNLLVDNNLINANHSAYIGKFDRDTIFYLKSRGLDEETINKLLVRGFLMGTNNLDEESFERVEQFLTNYINV